MRSDTGPWRLVGELQLWAESTPWCSWLELGGSLGRGAGDELSDLDAGLGVEGADRVPDVLRAALTLARAADSLVQPLGDGLEHVIVQYDDGRQLSLVVQRADRRPGLPPGSVALVDKVGLLGTRWQPASLHAGAEARREWSFLAWWALRDVAKHAGRGRVWRSLAALEESRAHAWRLHAAALGVDYPTFGAVSVDDAKLPAPAGMDATLPAGATATEVLLATRALAAVLTPLTAAHDVDGVRAAAIALLDARFDA